MPRRLLVSAFIFLLAMIGGTASACTAIGAHGGNGEHGKIAAGPLVQLPQGMASVEYGDITEIPPDAKAQTVTFKDVTGQAQGFGLRTYPNGENLPLTSWISDKWDPGRLLFLRSCRSLIGDCAVIVDSTIYQTNESPPQPDFPILAVIASGGRVVAVERLNGMLSRTPDILNLFGAV